MGKTWLIGLLLWGTFAAAWPASPGSVKAKGLYQEALNAYLNGDYDKASLWDTQALQLDPQNRRASELLNILVYEMNRAHQTDIWIGSQGVPALAKTPSYPAPPHPVRKDPRASPAQVAQLEAQIRVMNQLMGRDAEEQAKVFQLSRADEEGKWKDLSRRVSWLEGQSPADEMVPMRILCILALLAALIALMSSLKTRKELNRYKAYFLSRIPESEKIIPFSKYGR